MTKLARIGAPALFEQLARRIGGGRLVYAKPLRVGDRAVIPVARVRVRGGFGFGKRGPLWLPSDGRVRRNPA